MLLYIALYCSIFLYIALYYRGEYRAFNPVLLALLVTCSKGQISFDVKMTVLLVEMSEWWKLCHSDGLDNA